MKREEALKIYDELIAGHPEIERKGKNNPYTSLNGNMFTFLDKEGFISFRMSKEDQAMVRESHGVTESIQYGSVMRDYVKIPMELLSNSELMGNFLELSLKHAKTLKAK